MNNSFKRAVNSYLRNCKSTGWIIDESYKFHFANYIHYNVDWQNQTDDDILQIFNNSQKIRYDATGAGVQFIIKSGREKLGKFISLEDVKLLRQLKSKSFFDINWDTKSMSFTALSAWVASLFPELIYPVPMRDFDQTIKYLFSLTDEKLPKIGQKYIIATQKYMQETQEELTRYPIEYLFLTEWNRFYHFHPELNIPEKEAFNQVDKAWLAQDFHLFVHREILGLYSKKTETVKIQEISDPIAIEGNSILAEHLRFERNPAFIAKIKKHAISENKFLNCQICGFSFLDTYGEIGAGFIEAHHLNPISKSKGPVKTSTKGIALVCSNYHRMLHRAEMFSPEELRQRLNRN